MFRRTFFLSIVLVGLVAAMPVGVRAQDAVQPVDTLLTPPAQEAIQDVVGPEAAQEADVAVPIFLVLPFVALLLMIATGPLFYPEHWHHHYPKYAVGLGLAVAAYYFFLMPRGGEAVLHGITEYISFIALLASLFIASGGILIETSIAGKPRTNVMLLAIGAVISNVIGTTGASMLLIQPYMRLNKGRIRAYHIIFFIFTVSNVGGALTPIGDPPLFLGFLRGIPFFWTVTHIWYIWVPTLLVILGIFYIVDSRNKAQSVPAESTTSGGLDQSIRITGVKNFGWLALIIASVFIDPGVIDGVPDLHGMGIPIGIREFIMLAVCVLAYVTADKRALQGNNFTFEPIKEVGWLFVGIFMTMIPALKLIEATAAQNADALGVTHFYFGTGILSSVLDNAPTYLSFLSAALGKFAASPETIAAIATDPNLAPFTVDNQSAVFAMAAQHIGHPEGWHYVQAISVAAVFFGAMTYIGNGPNFMVKAIAESSGVECPSFFGYMVRYALPILLPIYIIVWLIFFSGWVIPLV